MITVDTDTGEFQKKRLRHREEAKALEASGHVRCLRTTRGRVAV